MHQITTGCNRSRAAGSILLTCLFRTVIIVAVVVVVVVKIMNHR